MADEQAHTLPLFGDDKPEASDPPTSPESPKSSRSPETADTVKREPLLMIMDGHAMVHRAFRAISTQRQLTVNATGEDVTGVFGFTNVFLRAL